MVEQAKEIKIEIKKRSIYDIDFDGIISHYKT